MGHAGKELCLSLIVYCFRWPKEYAGVHRVLPAEAVTLFQGNMPKGILLVDDCTAIRNVLRRHIEFEPDIRVCGEAADGVEAIEKAGELSPDLIVMDLSMPRMNGLAAAREIKQTLPQVPIILFTSHKAAIYGPDANEAGIAAVICKTEGQEVLIAQILDLLALA
jgi:DNA-binding NarL/FixJ family response regulator